MSAAYAAAGLGALQVWSGIQMGGMIRRQADLTAQISEMNAQFAEIDAWEAEKMGYTQTARYQSVIDATLDDQRAIMAAQGTDVGYGTAAELQAETRLTGFLNTLDMQQQARNQAYGFKTQASNFRLQGANQIMQGRVDSFGAVMGGVTSGAATAVRGLPTPSGY